MNTSPPIVTPVIAIYGVGLIGGSLAIDLKRAGAVEKIIGVGRSLENLRTAKAQGIIDEICDPLEAAAKADTLVLATPVKTIVELITLLLPALNSRKTITDVGSVKGEIAAHAQSVLGDLAHRFVPAHPIAGKEKSGLWAATQGLFENHKVIITPLAQTDKSAIQLVESLWRITGAQVSTMQVEDHDRVLSVTSHLPHMLSYVMMDFLATSLDREQCYEMAAGGFYDFTRTASSDPEMWRDIALMNDANLLASMHEFQNQLTRLADMIKRKDSNGIEKLFADAKSARAQVAEKRKTGL